MRASTASSSSTDSESAAVVVARFRFGFRFAGGRAAAGAADAPARGRRSPGRSPVWMTQRAQRRMLYAALKSRLANVPHCLQWMTPASSNLLCDCWNAPRGVAFVRARTPRVRDVVAAPREVRQLARGAARGNVLWLHAGNLH